MFVVGEEGEGAAAVEAEGAGVVEEVVEGEEWVGIEPASGGQLSVAVWRLVSQLVVEDEQLF